MSKRWPFSLLNDEQMSNWVGVKHLPVMVVIFVYFLPTIFDKPKNPDSSLKFVGLMVTIPSPGRGKFLKITHTIHGHGTFTYILPIKNRPKCREICQSHGSYGLRAYAAYQPILKGKGTSFKLLATCGLGWEWEGWPVDFLKHKLQQFLLVAVWFNSP